MTKDFIAGVKAAAAFASTFDSSSCSSITLGDLILRKFDIQKGRLRRNKKQLKHPITLSNEAFEAGISLAFEFLKAKAIEHTRKYPSDGRTTLSVK